MTYVHDSWIFLSIFPSSADCSGHGTEPQLLDKGVGRIKPG